MENKEGTTFVVEPVYAESVSPSRFLRMLKTEKGNIKSVTIVPASLGSKTFGGRLIVRRKRPIYRAPFRVASK